ncbi:MAG: glycoside hydrolase family 130 protein [Cytophagaceae bacterium]|nr:glycoside hydrolase family 130 protein [Cytophagaceae bacterium]
MKKTILLGTVLLVGLAGCRTSNQKEATATTDSTDWALLSFVKVDSLNPIIRPSAALEFMDPILKKSVKWEEKDVFNPAAVVRNGQVYMIYRAEDVIGKFAGTSRMGLAVSDDGLHFKKEPAPVFYPDNDAWKKYEWEGGCEDPRIVESSPDGKSEGIYIMTYTSYDGTTARLMLATSPDLRRWTKHGPILGGKFLNTWSKSGAIVSKRVGEKIVAEKVAGKYWMYFGDTDLFIASSDDLIHWTPLEDSTAQNGLKSVLKPRPGQFDSQLVEPGPYALLTEKGIVLIYNAANKGDTNNPTLPNMTYAAGQALYSASDPTKLIARLDSNFFRPDKPYELVGQVNNVCFLEGLVPFKGKWFLYYGTADSKIAVAVRESL